MLEHFSTTLKAQKCGRTVECIDHFSTIVLWTHKPRMNHNNKIDNTAKDFEKTKILRIIGV